MAINWPGVCVMLAKGNHGSAKSGDGGTFDELDGCRDENIVISSKHCVFRSLHYLDEFHEGMQTGYVYCTHARSNSAGRKYVKCHQDMSVKVR